MLGAFFCFATLDTTAKFAVLNGMPVWQTVFLRYVGHALVILLVFLPQHGRSVFASRARGREFLRALFLMGGTALNFAALQHLPLSVTISIFFATPLVVCALSVPILGERVGRRRWTAILIGFLGVLVITRPFGAGFDWAMLYSLGAALSASMYFVMTRMLAGTDSNMSMQIHAAGLPVLTLAPAMPGIWQPLAAEGWLLAAILGLSGAIGHLAATTAHRFAEASALAPVVYSQMLFATVYGFAVFGNVPDGWTLLGSAILIGSGLYLWARERRKGRT